MFPFPSPWPGGQSGGLSMAAMLHLSRGGSSLKGGVSGFASSKAGAVGASKNEKVFVI